MKPSAAAPLRCKAAAIRECPIRDLLSRLGDKWSMLVILSLAQASGHCCRFSELMRRVQGISQRMLTVTLRNLERDGLVKRRLYAEVPPRVEYTLTERGCRFLTHVDGVVAWIEGEWPEIEHSRELYDHRSG